MTLQEAYNTVLVILRETFSWEEGKWIGSMLLEEVVGVDRYHLATQGERPLDAIQEVRLLDMANRCKAGEPLQYICGHWGFYGLDFLVRPGVLIPRPDTEILVETALECLAPHQGTTGQCANVSMTDSGCVALETCGPPLNHKQRRPVVWDLCAGSGCVGVSIGVKAPFADIFAVEKFPEAFGVLGENISRLCPRVQAIQGDVLRPGTFSLPEPDVLVSNPPYLDEKEMAELSPQVAWEPPMALDGGQDGLLFYREIARLYKSQIRSGGWLIFEIGYTQKFAVMEILVEQGYVQVDFRQDFAGHCRVVWGQKF